MKRRGLGKGLGMGYKNLAPMDSHIHSLSARGMRTNYFNAVLPKAESVLPKTESIIPSLSARGFRKRTSLSAKSQPFPKKLKEGTIYNYKGFNFELGTDGVSLSKNDKRFLVLDNTEFQLRGLKRAIDKNLIGKTIIRYRDVNKNLKEIVVPLDKWHLFGFGNRRFRKQIKDKIKKEGGEIEEILGALTNTQIEIIMDLAVDKVSLT